MCTAKMLRNGLALGAMTLALASGSPAQAGLVTLTDDNSVAQINTQSQAGFFNWVVDGVDHMFQEWFWIRVGDGPEVSIDTAWVSDFVTDTNGDGNDDTMFSTFNNGQWLVELQFTLTGGNPVPPSPSTSDMAESIRITNVSGTALDFTFFEYTDYDLTETIGDDTAFFDNSNSIQQFDGSTHAETIAAPDFDRWQIGPYASILETLNDGSPTTLSNSVTPFTGDATFAMQWGFTLDPNGSFLVSKDKLITSTPEPSTWAMIGSALGLTGLGWARRRRRRRTA